MDTRFCTFCNDEHPLSSDFWYRLEGSPRCKVRVRENGKKRQTANRAEILAYQKKWREENKEHIREANLRWRKENAERHKENARAYYYANKALRNSQMKEYREKNRDTLNAKRRESHRKHPERRLSQNLRVRLTMALKRGSRAGSAVKDLGCSIQQLKKYLEAQFKPGMTWANYGTVWHVDHIRPLANYDLSDKQVLLELVHYTNLQPLFVLENLKKSNKE